MKVKRAIWISALLYVVTFLIGIIVGILAGTDFSGKTPISTIHWFFSVGFSVIATVVLSLWYFRGRSVRISAKEGFYLGLIFLATGVFFDALFLITYFFIGDNSGILAYYANPWFYVSVILIVLTPVVIGFVKKK